METNREITIIDLVKLLRLPSHYMTITTHDDEEIYKVCSIEVCSLNDDNTGNIFYTELDGNTPICTNTFSIYASYFMFTQPESKGILIEDKNNNVVATLEVKPMLEPPSIAELLDNN